MVSVLPLSREEVCGDAWEVIEVTGVLRAMVVDGLGHGPFAGEAAREAVSVFRAHPTTGVASTLKLVDQALTKTRGAAGAIVELCPETRAGYGSRRRQYFDAHPKRWRIEKLRLRQRNAWNWCVTDS